MDHIADVQYLFIQTVWGVENKLTVATACSCFVNYLLVVRQRCKHFRSHVPAYERSECHTCTLYGMMLTVYNISTDIMLRVPYDYTIFFCTCNSSISTSENGNEGLQSMRMFQKWTYLKLVQGELCVRPRWIWIYISGGHAWPSRIPFPPQQLQNKVSHPPVPKTR